MKLYDLVIQEDGSVKVDTEITPEEMRALLHIGVQACVQHGVMVASLAGYFQPPKEDVAEEPSSDEFDRILDRAGDLMVDDVEKEIVKNGN